MPSLSAAKALPPEPLSWARDDIEQSVTRDKLPALLKQKQARNAEQPVVISADKDVRYEEVIKIMDMLRQQKIKKVGLLAQSTDR